MFWRTVFWQSVKSGMHIEADAKDWKLQKFFYFALPHADVPNALKLPLCILSLNTTGCGCKNQLLSPGFMKLLLYYIYQVNNIFFNPNNIKIPCSKHIILSESKDEFGN